MSEKKPDVIYFVGCTSSYRTTEIAIATVKILEKAGVNFKIMSPDEWCCGSPMINTGQLEGAKKTMEHNLKSIRESGVEVVITSCAGCFKTFKYYYPKVFGELGFEVKHTIEYIDQLLREGDLELEKELNLKVTYHDPCHLGRLSEPFVPWEGERDHFGRYTPTKKMSRGVFGVYDAPRNVLKRIPGVELIEMERVKENAWCCGAGGGVKSAYRDFALWTASERIEEVKTTGADVLTSCCPFCKMNLHDAIKQKDEKMEIYDVIELVSKCI
ncbi:MAG: (Fe-S)-binding protein [Thermoplasmata archaeon]|nr:MAG: (Fe-S)-binding protein [Thermoplasmata archaeon]